MFQTISLRILHNYFDDSNKIIFKTVSQQNRFYHGSITIFNLNSRKRLENFKLIISNLIQFWGNIFITQYIS